MLVLLKMLILLREGNEQDDCGGEWVIVRRHRDSRKKNINISFNTPGARSHPGEGLKIFESPLGRAGPRPQSGASFSAFSTVSCPGLSPLAGSVGPRVAARSGADLFDEECRQDPEFLNRVLGLERMLRVKLQQEFPGTETASVSSGQHKGIIEIPEVNESALARLDERADGRPITPFRGSAAGDAVVVGPAFAGPRFVDCSAACGGATAQHHPRNEDDDERSGRLHARSGLLIVMGERLPLMGQLRRPG